MHYPPLFFNPPPQLRTYLVANIKTEKKCQLLLRAAAAAPLAKKKRSTQCQLPLKVLLFASLLTFDQFFFLSLCLVGGVLYVEELGLKRKAVCYGEAEGEYGEGVGEACFER